MGKQVKNGMAASGVSPDVLLRELMQQNGKRCAAAAADLTDSTGGTADVNRIVNAVPTTALTNQAASGSDLADTTTTAAALNAVLDGCREIATKANAVAALVGVDQITYSGGGAAADGTIGAISAAVTGAATGAQSTEIVASVNHLTRIMFTLTEFVNKVARATGVAEAVNSVTPPSGGYQSTVTAATIAAGSAASPGVKKAAMDAALVLLRNNVATLAARLNAMTTDTHPAPTHFAG